MLLSVLFWFFTFFVIWAYAGYPIALKIIAKKQRAAPIADKNYPSVSVVTTVYNEEAMIGRKLENCQSLSYPAASIEFIFISDGSTDATNKVLRQADAKNIVSVFNEERCGKDNSQGQGVAVARGEIIIFTDTRTILARDSIEKIVSGFSDAGVGCISGRDIVIDADGKSGEGAYVRYEMLLRELESRCGSTIVVSGCFFAIRKELCNDWHSGLTSDFYLPIHARRAGMRVLQASDATCTYSVAPSIGGEFRRKVRTIVNGLEVLFHYKAILNPFRYGSFALKMINHKLFRWLVPFALAGALFSNAFLWSSGWLFKLTMLGQASFYAVAALAYVLPLLQKNILFRTVLFFVVSNIAILAAWVKFARGESEVIWEPTSG